MTFYSSFLSFCERISLACWLLMYPFRSRLRSPSSLPLQNGLKWAGIWAEDFGILKITFIDFSKYKPQKSSFADLERMHKEDMEDGSADLY